MDIVSSTAVKHAFAKFHTKTLNEIPGFPGETVKIRKLNPVKVGEAASAVQVKALKRVDAVGGMKILDMATAFEKKAEAGIDPEVLAKAKANNAVRQAKIDADPYLALDRDTLLMLAIESWSFVEPGTKRLVAINEENIEDLEEGAKEYIGREIYQLFAPDEVATKNESAPSSVS